MVKDYTQLSREYREKQLEIIRATEETSKWLLDESELPQTTNVTDFIETKLSPLEIEITNSNAVHILSNLASKKWKAIDVLLAFLHRSIIAHQLVNPIAEFRIKESIEHAHQLDEFLERTNKPAGVLHGLPISVKDEFDVKGTRTTMGLISQAHSDVSDKTSPNLQALLDQGAIIFVKTNTPTAAFNHVTMNNLFGATLNPYNTNFTSGGSTGGEAALLALKGSPMGVGTDLGGSIRQPCSFTGLYGMKTSSGRVPNYNSKSVINGLESLRGTNGVIANDLDTLELYFKTVVDSKPWLKDTNVVNLPWDSKSGRSKKSSDRLRFAILLDDGKIRPTPPVERALNVVKSSLINAGHEVIEWNLEEHFDLSQLAEFANKFMASNGFKNLRDELAKSDEVDQKYFELPDLKVSELWDLQIERSLKVNEFWIKWNDLGIDGLISPVTALSGCKFDGFFDLSYSPVANVIDFPSVAFPVLKADKTIDVVTSLPSEKIRNETEKKVWDNYDPEESHGVPIGLQVIGPKLQEEATIELARAIVKSLDQDLLR